jgi:hypothetical protein
MAYCTGQDIINLALPVRSLSPLTQGQIVAACQAQSDRADGMMRGRYGTSALPLLTWDTAVTEAVAKMAAFALMRLRGMKPDSDDWKTFKSAADEGVDYFDMVQRQQMHPLVTLANGSAPGGAQPQVLSSSVVDLATGRTAANRGW